MRKVIILTLLFSSFLFAYSCQWTKPYFRKYSNQYLGIEFPYQLFVAQAWVESKCKINSISNDYVGSQGIGQITWRWWKDYLRSRGVPNLKTIDNQSKAQVLIMKRYIYQSKRKVPCKALYIPFQAYNGGWLIAREIRRANSCSWNKAKKKCHRRIIYFRNGSARNACDINYKYSKHIYKFATKYYGYVPYKDGCYVFY